MSSPSSSKNEVDDRGNGTISIDEFARIADHVSPSTESLEDHSEFLPTLFTSLTPEAAASNADGTKSKKRLRFDFSSILPSSKGTASTRRVVAGFFSKLSLPSASSLNPVRRINSSYDFVRESSPADGFVCLALDDGEHVMSGALPTYSGTEADFIFSSPPLFRYSGSESDTALWRSLSSQSSIALTRSVVDDLAGHVRHSTQRSDLQIEHILSRSCLPTCHGSGTSLSLDMRWMVAHPNDLSDVTTAPQDRLQRRSNSSLSSSVIPKVPTWRHVQIPALPDTIYGSLLLYLDHGSYRAVRLRDRPWTALSEDSKSAPHSAVRRLPTEVIQEILYLLSPTDFASARLACLPWLKASFDTRLLSVQLRRAGWWSAAQRYLAEWGSYFSTDQHFYVEQCLSNYLTIRCALPANGHVKNLEGLQSSIDFTYRSTTKFADLNFELKREGKPSLIFTVSTCRQYLMVARDNMITIYAMHKTELQRLCNVVCPRRVIGMSMDTSSRQYTVAGLLEGRIGILAEFVDGQDALQTGSLSGLGPTRHPTSKEHHSLTTMTTKNNPEKVMENSANIVKTAPRVIYRRLCSELDPPRSVAISPSRKCVAFGCSGGIQLHWVDALTGQELDRWFPITTPADHLFFLPPHEGTDSAKRLRVVSSPAHGTEEYGAQSDFTRGTSDLSSFRDASAAPPRFELAPSVLDGPRTSSSGFGHSHAIPLSDGDHMLYIDNASNLLCLGSDAPVGGPEKFAPMIMFIPPDDLASDMTLVKNGNPGCRLRPPPPVAYAATPDLTQGVWVIASYGCEIVMYSVPSDVFAQSFATNQTMHERQKRTSANLVDVSSGTERRASKTNIATILDDSTANSDWLDWWPSLEHSPWSVPQASHPNHSFPLMLKGIRLGGMDDAISDVAILSRTDKVFDMVVWAFSAVGQSCDTWTLGRHDYHAGDTGGAESDKADASSGQRRMCREKTSWC